MSLALIPPVAADPAPERPARPERPKTLTPDERRAWFRGLQEGDRIHVREMRHGDQHASRMCWPATVTEARMLHLGNGITRWRVTARVEAAHGVFSVVLPDEDWIGSPYSEYYARATATALLRHRALRILSGAPLEMVVRVLEMMLGEQVVAHGVPLDVLLVEDDEVSDG